MRVERYVAMDSLLCSPLQVSVVYVSEGEDERSITEAAEMAEHYRDAVDAVAFDCPEGDILALPGSYKVMKAVKPVHSKAMVVTPGTDRAALDDIMGGGFADMALIRIIGRITDAQKDTLALLEDYDYWYAVTAVMVPGVTDADAMREIAAACPGCKRFLIRSADPKKHGSSAQPFGDKEIRELTKAVGGLVKNPMYMGEFRFA